MRRVLIISPHFPPDTTAATHRVRLIAPQDRAQSCDELTRTERLDDIVVGAAVEAANPVALLAAGGKHDDRQRAGQRGAPYLTAHLDP